MSIVHHQDPNDLLVWLHRSTFLEKAYPLKSHPANAGLALPTTFDGPSAIDGSAPKTPAGRQASIAIDDSSSHLYPDDDVAAIRMTTSPPTPISQCSRLAASNSYRAPL